MARVSSKLTDRIIQGHGFIGHDSNDHVWVAKAVLDLHPADRWHASPPQYRHLLVCFGCNAIYGTNETCTLPPAFNRRNRIHLRIA